MTYLDGADVSAYQPDTIFRHIPTSFGIVKATEGTDYVSNTFKEQAGDILSQRKPLALYHFADGGNVRAEVSLFLSYAHPYIGKALLILDYEGRAVADGETWARTFLDYVRKETGTLPGLYGSRSWTSTYTGIPAAGYWLWDNYPVSSPPSAREAVGHFPASQVPLRQWTTTGNLNGYHPLDLDRFYGSVTDWTNLIHGNTHTINPADNGGIMNGAEDMLVGIKGEAGKRRGGLYFVSGGKAAFLGTSVPSGVPTLTDDAEIAALQSHVTGLA